MKKVIQHGGVDVLVDDGIFVESPRWYNNAFWFSDIGAGQVCRITPGGEKDVLVSGMMGPSGLGWTESGDMLVATLHDSTIYRICEENPPQPVAGPAQHGSLGTNDMATAGSRSYITCSGHVLNMGDDEAELSRPCGAILLLDHLTGECHKVADNLKMPNGIAITPDGKTLIVAELYACRVLKFSIAGDGSLSPPSVFVQLDHFVDGLCLDAEGGLWLGTGLDRFQRIDSEANPAGSVEVPEWSCVAPMLGGPDGRTLIMAVNQMDRPDAILEGRAKGRILTTRVDIPAAPQATGF